jgi:c(7)-type cytochrome triheme protein
MPGCQNGCHDGKRAFATTGTSCTKCHRAVAPPSVARADLPFSHAEHERRNVRIADCSSCHVLQPDGTLAASLHGKDHLPCATSGCHQTEFGSRTTKICGICHETSSPWAQPAPRTEKPNVHEWFQSMDHASHVRAAGTANSTCDGCHGNVPGGTPPPRGHRACASCHGRRQAPAMTDCTACHARTAPVRTTASAWSVATAFKHATHAADPRTARPTACIECHATIAQAKDLASIAAPTMQRCDSCHDGKLAFKATGFACARCHGGRP